MKKAKSVPPKKSMPMDIIEKSVDPLANTRAKMKAMFVDKVTDNQKSYAVYIKQSGVKDKANMQVVR